MSHSDNRHRKELMKKLDGVFDKHFGKKKPKLNESKRKEEPLSTDEYWLCLYYL